MQRERNEGFAILYRLLIAFGLTAQHSTQRRAPPITKQIHLDQSEQYKVNAECYPFEKIVTKSWFELPPAMAFYYKARNPFYRQPPPWLPGCYYTDEETMQIVWPDKPTRIFIPREIDSTVGGEVVFEVAHSRPDAIVFWYLNDEFIGQTNYFHKKKVSDAQPVSINFY